MVVSRDGFVLWSRSSEPALKSGLYFKTRGQPPIELPSAALACQRHAITGYNASTEHDGKVWFNQPCKEQVIFSNQYDFTISLLFFNNRPFSANIEDEETEEDTFDRFNRRTPSQGWF